MCAICLFFVLASHILTLFPERNNLQKFRSYTTIPYTIFAIMEYLYGAIDDAVIVELCRQQHLALLEDLREEEPEQLEEDDSLEEIDISAGDHSPPPKQPGFFAALFGAMAGVNMARGLHQKRHNGRCNGDCAHCPPHYGYRYGRWYYGHDHVHGCEFGGNKGNGSMD